MPRFSPYPRGFVLGRRGLDRDRLPSHFRVRPLVDRWEFAHDPVREPLLSVDAATGRFVLVHGTCVPVGEEPVADVAEWLLARSLAGDTAFLEALDVLAGRHVVVTGHRGVLTVYRDAVGARSVYYSPAAGLIASHAHLIHDLVPHRPTAPELVPSATTNTWTLTPWDGVVALLPNQRLCTQGWSVERFFPRGPNPYTGWSVEDRLAAVEAMWARQLDAIRSAFDDVAISVTGGADSRVVLAMARRHLHTMKGFTYTPGRSRDGIWTRMLSQDERLVRQLLELAPMDHEFFARDEAGPPVDPGLEALLARNTLAVHGRWLIPHYNRFLPVDDAVHLRGHALEIGRGYYRPDAGNDTVDAVRGYYAWKAAPRVPGRSRTLTPPQSRYFDATVTALGYAGPLWGYHRLDLLYWELRCGRWMSEVLNEIDVSFDSLVPVNVRAILDILLSFDLEDRLEGFAYGELVNRSLPVLNFVGMNDDRNLYEQVRDERRAGRQRGERVTGAWLADGCQVLDVDGRVLEDAPPDTADLRLPAEHFTAGRAARRRIGRVPGPGSLELSFHSPYARPRAHGKFEYRLVVSGRPVVSVDGAAWDRASRVTVHNLRAEDTVEIAVVALASMNRESWSAATRAFITDLAFTCRDPDGPVQVVSSNPYTRQV